MGIRERVQTDIRDFKDGLKGDFKAGTERAIAEEASGLPSDLANFERVLPAIVGVLRVAINGFVLTAPGVPWLPWGDAVGLVLALAAVIITVALSFNRDERTIVPLLPALAAVFAVVVAVTFSADLTTSMAVGGAIVAVVLEAARRRPGVYGAFVLLALFAVGSQLLGIDVLQGRELVFSGRASTPDLLRRSLLLVCALAFLQGMVHFAKAEQDRQAEKLTAAEQARDAAVADERARIARELHDVVSHHVTAMTLQSEAAAITGDRGALRAVASSGREALTELRRMLGVLRQPRSSVALAVSDTAPQPGLGELDRLVDRTRVGLDVRLVRKGDVRPLGAGVELCAFRVIQESLTNTTKHTNATTAEVTLTYGTEDLLVEVVDDGTMLDKPRLGGAGQGLIGMGERIALLEGELSTGPRPDGRGYRVLARLPLQA
jgi:signal transduction histidine kinase